MKMEIYFILVASFLSSALCEHITSKCHGNNYMNSICPNQSEVIAIKQLQYGAKSNDKNCQTQNKQHNNDTCCSHEVGDCLKDVNDYANKYLYFSRLSGLNVISQNTATPWIGMKCGNRTVSASDYVQVVFDCIKDTEIKNFCDYQKMTSTNGGLYLHRERYFNITNTCVCMVKSSESSTLSIFAVDVRLQPIYPVNENLTGECTNATNVLTISDNNNTTSIECENDTIYGELEKLYFSSGHSINISYSEEGKEPQSVWIFINASKGDFEIECNPRLYTTTSTTKSTTGTAKNSNPLVMSPGNQGNSHKNKTTQPSGQKTKSPGSKNSDSNVIETGPSARVRERAIQNTAIYCVIGAAVIATILIITAGFFIRRNRKTAEQQRKYKKVHEARLSQSDSSIFTLEKLPRETPTNFSAGSEDYLY